MVGATATATEMKNNFGRYLNLVISGQEVVVTKNGKEIGRDRNSTRLNSIHQSSIYLSLITYSY